MESANWIAAFQDGENICGEGQDNKQSRTDYTSTEYESERIHCKATYHNVKCSHRDINLSCYHGRPSTTSLLLPLNKLRLISYYICSGQSPPSDD